MKGIKKNVLYFIDGSMQKGVRAVKDALWVKEVENPVLKPLNEWRDELFGFWMVYSDLCMIAGIKHVVVRYFGTDISKLYSLYDMLQEASVAPTVGITCNQKSNWMGGVFLAASND